MLRVQWLASKLIQPRQCHPGVASNVFRIIKPTYKYKKHNGASVVPDFHRCCFVAAVVDSLFDDGAFQAILPKARSCKLRILRIRFYLKPAQLLGCSNLFVYYIRLLPLGSLVKNQFPSGRREICHKSHK